MNCYTLTMLYIYIFFHSINAVYFQFNFLLLFIIIDVIHIELRLLQEKGDACDESVCLSIVVSCIHSSAGLIFLVN